MNMQRGSALRLALIATLIGCSDPNELVHDRIVHLQVSSPYVDDRALLLQVDGPSAIHSVVAADTASLVHFRSPSDGISRIALFGDLTDEVTLSFQVPHDARLEEYAVVVVEAAGPQGALRNQLGVYHLLLEPSAD